MTGSTTTNHTDVTNCLIVEKIMEAIQGETVSESESGMSPCNGSDDSGSMEVLQDGHFSPITADEADDKPTASYIAIISMAIMSSPHKRMLLSEIYQWIAEKYPYFRFKDRSWRNSVRHNLSLNECFVKSGRGQNGKGNYWSIHPANVEDFSQGDFRRRRARRRVRKCEEMQRMQYGYPTTTNVPCESQGHISGPTGYTPMSSSSVSVKMLAEMFGMENVMSKEEQKNYFHSSVNRSPSVDVSLTIQSAIPSLLSPISPSPINIPYSTRSSPPYSTSSSIHYSTSNSPAYSTSSTPDQFAQTYSFQQENVPVTVSTVDLNNLVQMFPSPISVEDLEEWN